MNMAQVLQDSGVITSMARELGIDESVARAGAGALLPAIVAGVGRQAAAPPAAGGGLGGLAEILGGALGGGQAQGGGLGGALGGGLGGALGGILLDAVLKKEPTPTQPGNDILGQIFGSKDVSRGVAEEVSGSTGISSDLLKKMLPILAMAVVGYMLNRNSGGTAAPAQASAQGGGALGGALGTILTQVVAGMARR